MGGSFAEREMVFGQILGTGAIINVCLGFTPRHVIVMDATDTAGALSSIEWQEGMQYITNIAAVIKTKFASLNSVAKTKLAATYGISKYAGGDTLTYSTANGRWEAPVGTDASKVYQDGEFQQGAGGIDSANTYRCIGDVLGSDKQNGMKVQTTPGFTLAADSDVNVNNDVLLVMAWR